jgi:hypothetical protein
MDMIHQEIYQIGSNLAGGSVIFNTIYSSTHNIVISGLSNVIPTISAGLLLWVGYYSLKMTDKKLLGKLDTKDNLDSLVE